MFFESFKVVIRIVFYHQLVKNQQNISRMFFFNSSPFVFCSDADNTECAEVEISRTPSPGDQLSPNTSPILT